MSEIITVCYGEEHVWRSRKAAIDYFMCGVAGSDGSERDRYMTILEKLMEGMNYCTDSWD